MGSGKVDDEMATALANRGATLDAATHFGDSRLKLLGDHAPVLVSTPATSSISAIQRLCSTEV